MGVGCQATLDLKQFKLQVKGKQRGCKILQILTLKVNNGLRRYPDNF